MPSNDNDRDISPTHSDVGQIQQGAKRLLSPRQS